jgi:Ceramidase
MDWSSPIDIYCERTDASFWAEPANALTNAGFLIAAAAAFVLWRRQRARDGRSDGPRADGHDWPALALIVVVVAVGLGSFAFHTVATRGAMLADVIPIAIFIYGYLLLALRRFLHLPAGLAIAIVLAYAAGAQALSWLAPAGAFNGSVGYLPALVALIVVARAARGTARRSLELAVMLFALSLALRTIDHEACATLPLGTHFLWHLLNAAVLYVLLHAAIKEFGSGTAVSAHRGNS